MTYKISKFIEWQCEMLKDCHPALREIIVEVKITPTTGYKIVNNTKTFTISYPPTTKNNMACWACRNIVDELVYNVEQKPCVVPICIKCGG